MTIKKRLFISNILMIVVPLLVSIAVIFLGLLVSWRIVALDDDDLWARRQLLVFRKEIFRTGTELLEKPADDRSGEAAQKIDQLLNKNHAALIIYNDQMVRQFGEDLYLHPFIQNITALRGEGNITVAGYAYVFKTVDVHDKRYDFCLVSPEPVDPHQYIYPEMEVVALILIVLVLVAVYVTSRYLSKYVLRKIEEPLDLLVAGVGQIRDGNLGYRLNYEGQDEFAAVCADFNEMAVRLQDSVTQIQQQEQSRKELLADISHDLRTPLTSINAYVGGILDGVANTPQKQRQYLEVIQKKALDINSMVEQLFLFSKLELGEYLLYPKKLDVVQELSDMVESNGAEYAGKGLLLQLGTVKPGSYVYADPVQFRNLLSNLLSNSLKYKDQETGHLLISSTGENGKVTIILEDDGPGVEEAALPKLFDTFYRCDPARKNTENGSGLGLAICAKIAERMEGTIYAENAATGGLRIVIILPEFKEEFSGETDFDHRR